MPDVEIPYPREHIQEGVTHYIRKSAKQQGSVSLIFRVPAKVLRELGWEKDDIVEIKKRDGQTLVLSRTLETPEIADYLKNQRTISLAHTALLRARIDPFSPEIVEKMKTAKGKIYRRLRYWTTKEIRKTGTDLAIYFDPRVFGIVWEYGVIDYHVENGEVVIFGIDDLSYLSDLKMQYFKDKQGFALEMEKRRTKKLMHSIKINSRKMGKKILKAQEDREKEIEEREKKRTEKFSVSLDALEATPAPVKAEEKPKPKAPPSFVFKK